jgi:signal transduction histidine kinase
MDGAQGEGARADTRWMTYRELAQARGISAASAARLAFRKGWLRQPGNDGAARVAVPIGDDQPSPYDARTDARTGAGDAATGEAPRHGARRDVAHGARGARNAAEFRLAIEALRGELTASHAREAEAQARADRAEAARDAERARADALRDRAEAATEAERRADQAEQGREAARKRAHELANRLLVVQGAADRSEAEADELRRQAEAAQIAQAEAEADAEELRQAEAVRQGRGVLARLRAAWRGA